MLHVRSLLLVENSSPCATAAERNSAELCTKGNPAPPPCIKAGREGRRADKAGLEFLAFDGKGGEVCRHVTKHSVYIISPS